jgi:hypothetical protein
MNPENNTCECCGNETTEPLTYYSAEDGCEPGWVCKECVEETDRLEEENMYVCEHHECGRKGDDVVIHDWGYIALCPAHSVNEKGEPHCPRESRSGDAERCEWCVDRWREIDGQVECEGCGEMTTVDYGNNADVSCTCCKACWDKAMKERGQE